LAAGKSYQKAGLKANMAPRDLAKYAKDDVQRGQLERSNAAMQNGVEALALFGPAVVLAIYTGVEPATVGLVSELFVGFRFCYSFAYVYGTTASRALLRSTIWACGFVCTNYLLYKVFFRLDQ
jgi:uncharacterized MAPEG superfamily protein